MEDEENTSETVHRKGGPEASVKGQDAAAIPLQTRLFTTTAAANPPVRQANEKRAFAGNKSASLLALIEGDQIFLIAGNYAKQCYFMLMFNVKVKII